MLKCHLQIRNILKFALKSQHLYATVLFLYSFQEETNGDGKSGDIGHLLTSETSAFGSVLVSLLGAITPIGSRETQPREQPALVHPAFKLHYLCCLH